MKTRVLAVMVCVMATVMTTTTVNAIVVDFTGGTATLSNGATFVPNNNNAWVNVDYYVENGFKFDFIGGDGIIGIYDRLNDGLHGHWATGGGGTLTSILVTRTDESPFTMLSFELVTNTDTGAAGPASGNEHTWINSYSPSHGASQLLPPENFGGTSTLITLGGGFSDVTWISFTVSNSVVCFGIDNVEIVPTPEPATVCLFGLGALGLLRKRRA